ncbi:MAG: hypothetical protein O3B87_04010 [bacterium]|nr:hypothetical protein [bacterium]
MNQSNPIPYEEYIEVQDATKKVLSYSKNTHAYRDFTRAKKARAAFRNWEKNREPSKSEQDSYIAKAILPVAGYELTNKEFNSLYDTYSGAVFKVGLIDHNFQKVLNTSRASEMTLSVGGACILESVDMKLISFLQQSGLEHVQKKYVEEMFFRIPTWTQIVGTLIPAKGLSVMYDETFPWYLRIKDLGLSDAHAWTQRKYDQIHSGVQRYAKLIDPNNIVVKIPFSQLALDKNNHLNDWIKDIQPLLKDNQKKYGLPSVDIDSNTFYKGWVEYTYMGPRMLLIVKELIKQKSPQLYKDFALDKKQIHIRGKQIDHLDAERHNAWMRHVILGNKEKPMDQMKLLTSSHGQLGVALYMWMRDNYKKNSSIGFAGFLDMNFKGDLSHENYGTPWGEIKRLLKDKHIKEICNSPLRLHTGNVDSFMDFLSRFKSPHAVSFSKEVLISIIESKNIIKKLTKKLKVLNAFIKSFCAFIEVLEVIEVNNITTSSYLHTQKDLKIMEAYISMRLKGSYLNNKKNPLDMVSFKALKRKIQIIPDENLSKQSSLIGLKQMVKKYLKHDIDKKEQLTKRLVNQKASTKPMVNALYANIDKHQSDYLTPYVTILPLIDNMFFSYLQQFLFIPSVRKAYLEMVNIQENPSLIKNQKEELISASISNIFPVIEDGIRYIMCNTEYPWKTRFETIYESVC